MASKSKRRVSPTELVASLTADEKTAIREAWAEGLWYQAYWAYPRELSTSTKRKAERVLPIITTLRDGCEKLAKLHTYGPSKGTTNFGRAAEIDEFLGWLSRIEQGWQKRAGRNIKAGRPSVDDLYPAIVRRVGEIANAREIRVTAQGVFPLALDAIGKALRLKDWRLPNSRTLDRIIRKM